jgi:hypothetical protein
MGLENRQDGKYLTIFDGKFCIRVKEGTEGATQRVNKENNTVYEKYYTSFTAKLVGIRTSESKYGKSWNFDFRDSGEMYTLQLPWSNSFASNFLKKLPNIDLEAEMKVQPVQKVENGKKKTSLFVTQHGQPVKHAYTREVPNGLPQMEQIEVKGQLMWDDGKQIKFLHDMVVSTILPKLSHNAPVPSTPVEAPASQGGLAIDDFSEQEAAAQAVDGDDPGF